MARGPVKHCPQCRYPMLRLAGFEGVSSKDAPNPSAHSGYGESNYHWFGLLGIIWSLLCDLAKEIGLLGRKRKVKQLRAEILPQYPDALICPHCFTLNKQP
jgi:hypothetical protein